MLTLKSLKLTWYFIVIIIVLIGTLSFFGIGENMYQSYSRWFAYLLWVGLAIIFIIERIERKKSREIILDDLERKMLEENYDRTVIAKLLSIFESRVSKNGIKKFQKWITSLNYRLPEELENEQVSIDLYDKGQAWFESEVVKLEEETQLTWIAQTEDIKNLDEKARKAQLVIRTRLTELVIDMLK